MKVIVALMTAEGEKYKQRLQACQKTWVPYIPNWASLWITSGPRLGVPDDYDMMSSKVQALCKRAMVTPDWEWLLRVDDDVCVDWSAVKLPTEGDYIGLEVPRRGVCEKGEFAYVAGAAQWLSRRAVQALLKMDVGQKVIEDLSVGKTLFEAEIAPTFVDVYTMVRRPEGTPEVTFEVYEGLRRTGFCLECGTPENMIRLHDMLGLTTLESKPAPEPLIPRSPVAGTIYRDLQGRERVRGGAVFSHAKLDPPLVAGAAVARPQEDEGWKNIDPLNILRNRGLVDQGAPKPPDRENTPKR